MAQIWEHLDEQDKTNNNITEICRLDVVLNGGIVQSEILNLWSEDL